jgi:hypothetical protein
MFDALARHVKYQREGSALRTTSSRWLGHAFDHASGRISYSHCDGKL